MEDNKALVKTEEELKPTLTSLENDQSLYDPHEDDQYLTQGTYLLKRLSDAKKKIEDQRIAFTKPLNESLRQINDFFRELSYPIQVSDSILRTKLTVFRKEQEDAQKELVELANTQSAVEVEVEPLRKRVGGVTHKKVWSFKIIDEKKIPKKYWSLSEMKIREAIRLGKRSIPGVEIYQDTQVSL